MACMGQLSKSQVADSVAAHLVIKTALKTWNYKMSDSTAFEYAATPGDSDVMWARLIEAAGRQAGCGLAKKELESRQ